MRATITTCESAPGCARARRRSSPGPARSSASRSSRSFRENGVGSPFRLHPQENDSRPRFLSLYPIRSVVEPLAVRAVAALARLPQCAGRRLRRVPVAGGDAVLDRVDLLPRILSPRGGVGLASRFPERLRFGERLLQDADI